MRLFGALGLDIKILVAQFVNFAVLFFVLYKFGYKPIFEFLEKRRSGIEKGLSDAKKAEGKLAEITEKEESVLLEAKKESQKIIIEAEKIAQKNKESILSEAKQEGEKIIISAQKKIEEGRKQAVRDVKNEISGLVVSATEKILREKIDTEKDRVLINKAVQ